MASITELVPLRGKGAGLWYPVSVHQAVGYLGVDEIAPLQPRAVLWRQAGGSGGQEQPIPQPLTDGRTAW